MEQKSQKQAPSRDTYKYLHGFGNEFQSEALKGALPKIGNTPKRCPYGAIAEQLSGTAFTAPRGANQRTWFYRIRPSTEHTQFKPWNENPQGCFNSKEHPSIAVPNQYRWLPMKITPEKTWVESLYAIAGNGDPTTKGGLVTYLYSCGVDMTKRKQAFCNADGDMLIVPQQGALNITTECGRLWIEPNQFAVIQRGIKFCVDLPDKTARGYICEVFDSHFALPSLGPIGSNGLANPRDFQTPTAYYQDLTENWTIIQKFAADYFSSKTTYYPFNVIAWHGNYVPYKYDLAKFCVVNSVSFDHLDPCIFVVLSAPINGAPGTACCDFVCFPPRWSVHENTFRPPYYHRNTMSELMGLISGSYEAKHGSFLPGGVSLHNCMTPHGPDTKTFVNASNFEDKPERIAEGTMAFMFESYYMMRVSQSYANDASLDTEYNAEAWLENKIPRIFDASKCNHDGEKVVSKPQA